MKKLWLILLATVLALLMVGCDQSGGASQEEGKPSVGLEFKSNGDGTCSVVGRGECTDTDVVIPETSPEGDTVTSIGASAFAKCTDLKSVTIPNGVTSIGASAFAVCRCLRDITIPAGVTNIGQAAFSHCMNLKTVVIPNGVKTIEAETFSGCRSLTSIMIPDGVKTIEAEAFSGCLSLTSVMIPDGVTSIGSAAFRQCMALESLVLPDSVVTIGAEAFKDCIRLSSLNIPPLVYTLESGVFDSCIDLMQTENGVTYIDKWVYRCDRGVTSVTLRADTVGIAPFAFYGCGEMTDIEIPKTVLNIGTSAIDNCDSLTSVTYVGTQAEWNMLVRIVPSLPAELGDDCVIHCTDGDITPKGAPVEAPQS
jgi:hypothetical protein